jgi:aromatic ring-cleaving dioxygenase
VVDSNAPCHAHIYYTEELRDKAADLRARFQRDPAILFVGAMTDRPAGPHPIPQYEIHFTADAWNHVATMVAPTGLRALLHPLTQDDVADHTSLGHWIGEPVALDLGVLDPVGQNQGLPRFGISDF